MIIESIRNVKNRRSELRKFAFSLFCALGFLGGLVLFRKGETGFLFCGIGIAILVVGLIKPGLLRPIHKGWMGMSFLIGFFMIHLILALVMRILGKDALQLKHDQNAKSYWIRKSRSEFTKEAYERMF